MKQNQFEFKPLDQVLVRDADQGIWKVTLFSHYNDTCEKYKHVTVSGQYSQCIPYNEETAHLIGTDKPYQPKVKEVTYKVTYGFGKNSTTKSYTEEDFKHFINVAVCNNKDIKDFSVNIIIPD